MPSPPPFPGHDPRRILIRAVNWLGDAVMTTPALQRLRERFPQAHLALLTPEKLAPLWQHHPATNEILSFTPGESVLTVAARLRRGKFDLALVLPNSPRSALEVWLAGIPERVGYARPWRNWFLTNPVPPRAGVVRMRKRSVREIRQLTDESLTASRPAPPPAEAHQIHEYLHLVAALGANSDPLPPRLELLPEETRKVEQRWLNPFCQKLAGAPPSISPIWVGLNPSAAYGPAKRWPIERFAAVASEISRQKPDCRWLIIGAGDDRQAGEDLARRIAAPVLNLAGETSLRQLMAVLKSCRLLLSNDSGPMHVAAALGIPVVVPFGSTSAALTSPGLPGDPCHQLLSSDAACAPCFRRECPIDFRCMQGITAERVTAAVCRTLG
jgi:heptosyltransferase II